MDVFVLDLRLADSVDRRNIISKSTLITQQFFEKITNYIQFYFSLQYYKKSDIIKLIDNIENLRNQCLDSMESI